MVIAAHISFATVGPDGRDLCLASLSDEALMVHDVVLDISSEASDIAFGYFLNGHGTVWAREFKLEPVGNDVAVSTFAQDSRPNPPVNLDFDH